LKLHDKEHHELIFQFEKDFPYLPKVKEPKDLWSKGNIYTNGDANKLFKAYQMGYSFAKCTLGE
jgi:hypothetical protein